MCYVEIDKDRGANDTHRVNENIGAAGVVDTHDATNHRYKLGNRGML